MKKLRKIWYRFNDLLDKIEPKGPKEWAVFLWMAVITVMLIAYAANTEDLCSAVLELLKAVDK